MKCEVFLSLSVVSFSPKVSTVFVFEMATLYFATGNWHIHIL